MKRNSLTILYSICVLFIFNVQANAQDSLIHYWHFNSFVASMYTPTISAIPADYTLIPTATPRILYAPMPGVSSAYSTYCDNVGLVAGTPDYDTVNARMSQPSGSGFRTRNPCDSMYLYFYIPSTGFRNLVLTFASEPSSGPTVHGVQVQHYDYSTDGGTTWKHTLLSDSMYSFTTPPSPLPAPDSTMQRITIRFTSDSAVNNNPNLVFRIHFSINTTGTSGNDRFDNITLDGTPYPPSTSIAKVAAAANTYSINPNPAGNEVNVSSESEGYKSIIVSNAAGQNVYYGMGNGKKFSINTSNLAAGVYFVSIRESNTGAISTVKFVKQ